MTNFVKMHWKFWNQLLAWLQMSYLLVPFLLKIFNQILLLKVLKTLTLLNWNQNFLCLLKVLPESLTMLLFILFLNYKKHKTKSLKSQAIFSNKKAFMYKKKRFNNKKTKQSYLFQKVRYHLYHQKSFFCCFNPFFF